MYIASIHYNIRLISKRSFSLLNVLSFDAIHLYVLLLSLRQHQLLSIIPFEETIKPVEALCKRY